VLLLLQLYEKLIFYYAFGNTPPAYVLLADGAKDAFEVLLLASGDLRSALYSLERDSRRRVPVKFTANDASAHVIARNVLLLWLAHNHESVEDIFAVWFSLGLSTEAKAALDAALAALTGEQADVQLEQLCIDFESTDSRKAVTEVLREWATWELSWSRVQELRKACMCMHLKKDSFPKVLEALEASSQWWLIQHNMQGNGDASNKYATSTSSHCVSMAAAVAEAQSYYREGVVDLSAQPASICNVTLLASPDAYLLHYGSLPYKAFALFEASYDARKPLLTSALAQLNRWIAELRTRARDVSWTFAVGDCLHVCGKLMPAQFTW